MPARGLVLLVGEDDAFAMYGEYLRFRGVDAQWRSSPADALGEMSRLRPAIVVSELIFAGRVDNGCAFIQAVRDHPAVREAIILIVTGYVRAEDAALARECGADQYFAKPLLPDTLMHAVEDAFDAIRRKRRPTWNWPDRPPDRRQISRRKPPRQ